LLLHKLTPLSLDELLLSSNFDAVILGPKLGAHSSWNYARTIKQKLPKLSCLAILDQQEVGLLNLKKFEREEIPVLQQDDSVDRIVHAVSTLEKRKAKKELGKVIYFEGSKGGVGVTSVISGLAHASVEIEKKAVIVDLSPYSTFSNYLLAKRSCSPDLSVVIEDGIRIEDKTIENSIEKTICGIEVLLPPSCKSDLREKWLRNPDYLEYGLETIEILKEKYDLVLIDGSGTEGILPFSLLSRSDLVVAVTSDDPAAAYLLDRTLKKISAVPGAFQTHVLLNETTDTGLEVQDIESILRFSSRHDNLVFHRQTLALDNSAAKWPGTGNSFYTESKKGTQQALRRILEAILAGESTALADNGQSSALSFEQFIGLVKNKMFSFQEKGRALLPAPPELGSSPSGSDHQHQPVEYPAKRFLSPEALIKTESSGEKGESKKTVIESLYQPAQPVEGPCIMELNEK